MIFYEKVSVSFLEEGIELISLTIRALLKPLVPTGLVSLPIDSLRHHVTCFVTKWLVKQISLGPFITEHLRQLFSANINFALLSFITLKNVNIQKQVFFNLADICHNQ